MTAASAASGVRPAASRRRWLVSEVVQTSSMDCGPAALKCLLEGFYIPVSYGRLREACQTDVDGTSIDTIETVANQLGVRAEQEMLPVDHLFLSASALLPALLVVRRPDGPPHFVIAWRRIGSWLQVMDPETGKRWVRGAAFLDELYRHEVSVPAAEWRSWVASDQALAQLGERMRDLGVPGHAAEALLAEAAADEMWFGFGALDAAVRLVELITKTGGIRAGRAAADLVSALFADTCASPDNIFKVIPKEYWSVLPDASAADRTRQYLLLSGAVVLRVLGPAGARARGAESDKVETPALSPELIAALTETPPSPLLSVWATLKEDGLLGPLALAGAVAIAVAGGVLEILIFRGLFDVGQMLNVGSQRLLAVVGLLVLATLLLAIQIPIVAESLRMGRHLEVRLRMALLRKLPHLADRYFQSRPISDMADRGHSIHLTRLIPGIGIHLVQTLGELALTFAGVVVLDPASIAPSLLLVLAAIAVPAALQPIVNERDLRVRIQAGALSGFYLDTLLGLMPVRAHRAEAAVRHQHEALLVEWARSSRRLVRASTLADAVQTVACIGLAGYLLVDHFVRRAGATGADLLLIYWTLKLPAIATTLTGLAQQYPLQRNVLLRLLEPLAAPEDLPCQAAAARTRAAASVADANTGATASRTPPAQACGAAITIERGSVNIAGRPILHDIELRVAPGEHVAIVGRSGAGKSTLLGLMLGWHRLASGQLRVDGRELAGEALTAFRHRIAWVDPAIQIWNNSFLANLEYAARDPQFGAIAAAVEAADLRGVLKKLPAGLQTRLGEGGGLLSGGEGQRVRLARALVQADVRLALLDEPFRGTDRAQRSSLLAETRRRWKGVTLLCVTHDVDETLVFDRVLVVEEGRIVEQGDPAVLAGAPSRYRRLLDAESEVRKRTWAGAQWRHVSVQDGHVVEPST